MDNRFMDIMSPEVEIRNLTEENRRLKALIELREDNQEMERYQIQSRNKLLLLLVFTVLCVGVSWILYFETKAQLNAQIEEARAEVRQMDNKLRQTGKISIQNPPGTDQSQ